MAKKSLLYFTDDSIKDKSVKAKSFVVSEIGVFFQDVADHRANILIEGDLNISLESSFVIIDEKQAEQLKKEKASPSSEMLKLKQENEELKKQIETLKKENEELKKTQNKKA